MEKKNKAFNISDLAELCGVSRSAVSAALGLAQRSNTRISKEKADFIREQARRCHFRPNRTARHLQASTHGCFGLLVQDIHHVPPAVLVVLLEAMRQRDKLLFVDTYGDYAPTSRFFSEDTVDAVATFSDLPAAFDDAIAASGVPVLRVNANPRSGAAELTFDERGAVRQAVEYLRARGATNVTMMESVNGHYSVAAREAAYRELAAAGATGKGEYLGYEGFGMTPARLAGHLNARPETDGLICTSLYEAVSFLLAWPGLRTRKRPQDFSVVVFCWPGMWEPQYDAFAKLLVQPRQLGAAVADALEAMARGEYKAKRTTLAYELEPPKFPLGAGMAFG
ncbi:MAG: LacI family DNA-binding transcriptional regulator [Planctomycetes bacterium]|nr:LacI family DNA-binding transcriptional regulator [Planctomycetota bacterium]